MTRSLALLHCSIVYPPPTDHDAMPLDGPEWQSQAKSGHWSDAARNSI
jgi:hypothetical protein